MTKCTKEKDQVNAKRGEPIDAPLEKLTLTPEELSRIDQICTDPIRISPHMVSALKRRTGRTPDHSVPLDPDLMSRIAGLVGDIEIDLEKPLSPDDA